MFEGLKNIFKRSSPVDPLAEQRKRVSAIVHSETRESAAHHGPVTIDINALMKEINPAYEASFVGTANTPHPAAMATWLRAEPNPLPDTSPMTYRVFHLSMTAGPKAAAHAVMISDKKMNKEDVVKLFTRWQEESKRIAAMPPPAPPVAEQPIVPPPPPEQPAPPTPQP